MTLRPTHLPKIRSQTIRLISGLDGGPFMLPGDENLVAALVADLRAADLYWVSDDMTSLSMHAGQSLDEARWAPTDRPSPCGLALFQGGLGMVELGAGLSGPVEALAWGPGPDATLRVWHLVSRRRLFGDLPDVTAAKLPPLIAIREVRLPVTDQPVSLDALPAHEGLAPPRAIIAALAASWRLMQQPQLVERTSCEPSRSEARALRRADMPDGGVTLVNLRRQYTPQDRDPDAGGDGRRYRYRWVVSGHWRRYRDERYSEDVRAEPQWIPAHSKGPEGAPLLATERVNVWRR
ncbi:hypothetical protein [Streptomyces sp. NPDC101145]|uniref:hypothetical protein n=1 Tax=Streptomyces sp. NPDC101145 TaxID=3366112 RepID=UPI003820D23A